MCHDNIIQINYEIVQVSIGANSEHLRFKKMLCARPISFKYFFKKDYHFFLMKILKLHNTFSTWKIIIIYTLN